MTILSLNTKNESAALRNIDECEEFKAKQHERMQ